MGRPFDGETSVVFGIRQSPAAHATPGDWM
jgi:hypothetical protein